MPTQRSESDQPAGAPPAAPLGDVNRPNSGLQRIFLAMALLLVVTMAVTFLIGQFAHNYSIRSDHYHQTVDDLQELLSTCKDAETGQRGYLITQNDTYLAPYNHAITRIPGELTALDAHAADELLDPADVKQLRALTEKKISELQSTIDLSHSPAGFTAAIRMVKTNLGLETMDAIRDLDHRMIVQSEHRSQAIGHTWLILSNVRTLAFAGTALVNLLFLVWAYGRIHRETRQREEAFKQLARQQQLTAVTLASIGDGVIVTNSAGNVTFINKVAVDLTGWEAQDAIGQPCTAVFNIINETTRKPVENPVEKVLRTGVAVGLANHTVLIRKDGSEIPIDDSGAPIRAEDGTVYGVVMVFRDFTGRRKFEENLRIAKEEAEAANIAKDNFLAVLSHELRTPLTPVLVTLTAWEQDATLPGDMREDVPTLRRCIELEARIIDDLLDLTRIIRGKLALNFEIADVHSLLQSVAGLYRSELDGKSIRLSMSLGADEHHATVDTGRMQQVFINILKNAAKFTPTGGKIDITTANVDHALQIAFTDTGVGMSSETMKRIFQPFEQGSAELVRRYGGLGLGLSLSKMFVEAQSGKIAADSQGPGKGATFTITLHATAPPLDSIRPKSIPRKSSEPGRSLRILLVEDHQDTAHVLRRLLERLGHHVELANTVAAAIKAAEKPFDLLLSDIGLPDGTGNDLIRQLRKTRINVPAVALTGFGMEEDIARSREAGFTDYITKPVNFQRLQIIVQRIADAR